MENIDLAALAWFVLAWGGYIAIHNQLIRRGHPSLGAAMVKWRRDWSVSIASRENRILDGQIVNGLIQKDAFFASTTILIIAGLVAMFGAEEKAHEIAETVPFVSPVTPVLWSVKVGLLAAIFVYAFFKFTWSIRQHSYSALVMVCMVDPSDQDPLTNDRAERMAKLSDLAAEHFNDGVRSYYFAMAALGWFVHSLVFIVATAWIVAVLYRREFKSRSLAILQE